MENRVISIGSQLSVNIYPCHYLFCFQDNKDQDEDDHQIIIRDVTLPLLTSWSDLIQLIHPPSLPANFFTPPLFHYNAPREDQSVSKLHYLALFNWTIVGDSDDSDEVDYDDDDDNDDDNDGGFCV